MMLTLTIVLAEFTTVLLVVVTVISVKALSRRLCDEDAVNTFVISIKANQPARIEKLTRILQDTNHLSEDDAHDKANELIKKQNKFYQEAIKLYLTRDNEVLSKLDNRLEDLLNQYQVSLKISTTDNLSVDIGAMEKLPNNMAAMSKELEELRAEKSTLSERLSAAVHELDQLGREYVSAFNKPKVTKVKGESVESPLSTKIGQKKTMTEELHGVENTSDIPMDKELPMLVEAVGKGTPGHPEVDASVKPVLSAAKENAELDVYNSSLDESDDQSFFAFLGLDELIGEHPGQRSAGVNSTGKK